jgi:hypothetical protein
LNVGVRELVKTKIFTYNLKETRCNRGTNMGPGKQQTILLTSLANIVFLGATFPGLSIYWNFIPQNLKI